MDKAEVMQSIHVAKLIPVLRAESAEEALALVEALVAGGIQVVEITLTVPEPLLVLRRVRQQFPQLLVGAGTVLDPETARICMLEGAQFIVSPALNLKTVELCRRYGTAVFPGALTPTEILTAWQAGADAIKVFPANAMGGASYLRSLRAPFPQIPLIPTGGVSIQNAREFLDSGAMALGVGADLVDTEAMRQGRPDRIQRKVEEYLRSLRSDPHAQKDPGGSGRPNGTAMTP